MKEFKIKAKNKTLSICECGFLALQENIPVGTEYEIQPLRWDWAVWTCGGCGKEKRLITVSVTRDGGPDGFLPLELFDLPEKLVNEITEKAILADKAHNEQQKLDGHKFIIQLDHREVVSMVALLQLALRHPALLGDYENRPVAQLGRRVITVLKAQIPEDMKHTLEIFEIGEQTINEARKSQSEMR